MSHRLDKPRRPLTDSLTAKWEPGDAAWWRIYHKDWQTPDALHRRNFGPLSRFDHHTPSPSGAKQYDPGDRAVTYLAADIQTAASEVFWDIGALNPIAKVCPRHWLAQTSTKATVTLVDLVTRGGFDAIGAPPQLSTGSSADYDITQEWAAAMYDDLAAPGIKYPGAHDLGACVVLFENAPRLAVVEDDGLSLDLPIQHPEIWNKFRKACKGANPHRVVAKISSTECPRCQELGLGYVPSL